MFLLQAELQLNENPPKKEGEFFFEAQRSTVLQQEGERGSQAGRRPAHNDVSCLWSRAFLTTPAEDSVTFKHDTFFEFVYFLFFSFLVFILYMVITCCLALKLQVKNKIVVRWLTSDKPCKSGETASSIHKASGEMESTMTRKSTTFDGMQNPNLYRIPFQFERKGK